jgi:hypothetical protein
MRREKTGWRFVSAFSFSAWALQPARRQIAFGDRLAPIPAWQIFKASPGSGLVPNGKVSPLYGTQSWGWALPTVGDDWG